MRCYVVIAGRGFLVSPSSAERRSKRGDLAQRCNVLMESLGALHCRLMDIIAIIHAQLIMIHPRSTMVQVRPVDPSSISRVFSRLEFRSCR